MLPGSRRRGSPPSAHGGHPPPPPPPRGSPPSPPVLYRGPRSRRGSITSAGERAGAFPGPLPLQQHRQPSPAGAPPGVAPSPLLAPRDTGGRGRRRSPAPHGAAFPRGKRGRRGHGLPMGVQCCSVRGTTLRVYTRSRNPTGAPQTCPPSPRSSRPSPCDAAGEPPPPPGPLARPLQKSSSGRAGPHTPPARTRSPLAGTLRLYLGSSAAPAVERSVSPSFPTPTSAGHNLHQHGKGEGKKPPRFLIEKAYEPAIPSRQEGKK